MKTLSLKANLEGITLDEKKPIDIVIQAIETIIMSYANITRGLTYEEQRQFMKIKDKLDEASKNNLEELELEDAWVGFLRKCMRESKLMPNILINRVFDLIEDIKDR